MSDKRFEVGFDEKRIFDIYAVNKNTTEYDIHKSCDLINSLYEENEQLREKAQLCTLLNVDVKKTVDLLNSLSEDIKHLEEYCGDLEADVKQLTEEISYWKHRVSSLLMILSQFDNEKVKKLLEELDEL